MCSITWTGLRDRSASTTRNNLSNPPVANRTSASAAWTGGTSGTNIRIATPAVVHRRADLPVSMPMILAPSRVKLARVNRDRAGAHLGVGAFNLVRTSTYRTLGGHEPLRMEVADDLKLALLAQRWRPRPSCRSCFRY